MATGDLPHSCASYTLSATRAVALWRLFAALPGHQRRTEEQPLDELDDPFAVKFLARAGLDGETPLQGGAHQIVEQFSIRGRIKWRDLPLGDDVLEVRVQGACDLIFRGPQARYLPRRLPLHLVIAHEAQVLA